MRYLLVLLLVGCSSRAGVERSIANDPRAPSVAVDPSRAVAAPALLPDEPDAAVEDVDVPDAAVPPLELGTAGVYEVYCSIKGPTCLAPGPPAPHSKSL